MKRKVLYALKKACVDCVNKITIMHFSRYSFLFFGEVQFPEEKN